MDCPKNIREGGVIVISPKFAKIIKILPKSWLRLGVNIATDIIIKKYATFHIQGKENLDKIDGPVIYICNHLSNSDGLIMVKLLKNKNATFVTGVKLFQNNTTDLIMNIASTIPIKPNSADKGAITEIVSTIKKGGSIFIFPEGTRSRTRSMQEAKKGIVLMVKLAGVPIVPISLQGSDVFMPINDDDMAAETFKKADIYINIGEPFELPKKEKEEKRHDYEDRALNTVMKSIAVLLPESYRGVYKD